MNPVTWWTAVPAQHLPTYAHPQPGPCWLWAPLCPGDRMAVTRRAQVAGGSEGGSSKLQGQRGSWGAPLSYEVSPPFLAMSCVAPAPSSCL